MPIYEYACKSCGHVFDVLQKMSADPLKDCPECGKPELKKLLSAPNFRLKGGGWYETDFKKDNQRNLAEGSAKSAGKTDASSADSGKSNGSSNSQSSSQSKSESPSKSSAPSKSSTPSKSSPKAD
ncbi:MAG: zinc ribbon domain-containing protein [Gammaproteobacteria bacterium]|nr:zinc ribbon domain-containing protein [Gammaproteobacteria bacterium]